MDARLNWKKICLQVMGLAKGIASLQHVVACSDYLYVILVPMNSTFVPEYALKYG